MAFHLGSLGFLTPFNFENFQSQVTQVIEGKFKGTRCGASFRDVFCSFFQDQYIFLTNSFRLSRKIESQELYTELTKVSH